MIAFGGVEYREHLVEVPLVWGADDPRRITVFARELVREGRRDAPYLVWFQGGPGNRAQRPESISGWLDAALNDHRVVLLDQRGTGRSTPADAQSLAGLSSAEQAEYLRHFRADSIVSDAEAVRDALEVDTWWALGQSFGGFILTRYLSAAPSSLAGVMIAAGLPPFVTADGGVASADDVYAETYPLTARRNDEFFTRYPGDRELCGRVARHLADVEELLPTGERLTPERFQKLGIGLGTASDFDALHYALEDPFTVVSGARRLKSHSLAQWGVRLSMAQNPLYAVLHESIYGRPGLAPTAWAAHRVRNRFEVFATPPEELGERFCFVGEHMFPWQFEQDPALAPLRGSAELLAEVDDWGELYDLDALAANQVPVAAAMYTPDMFVPFASQQRTAALIAGLRPVISAEYQHDGIRADGATLYGRLKEALA
ncbi:alpha/beta fold hydrolase [Micropruina sp.]|uniref:alpha/beta fold hydrolase n=1 Tax=Micropruina sp. TaxID=2737536 RepID=UPI0039E3CAAA